MERFGGPILEIGGFASGHRAVATSRWGTRPVTVNSRLTPGEHPHVVASGTLLPFRDDAFQQVVLIDTLEHVASTQRSAVLREAIRVAARYVWLLFPFGCAANVEAERELRLVAQRAGVIKESLEEHLRLGLPNVRDVLRMAPTNHVGVEFVSPRAILFASLRAQLHLQCLRLMLARASGRAATVVDRVLCPSKAYRALIQLDSAK